MAVELVKIVSQNFDIPDSHKLEVALKHGRYESIDKLFTMKPDDVTEEVCKSGLRMVARHSRQRTAGGDGRWLHAQR